jgi:hypothetical protein
VVAIGTILALGSVAIAELVTVRAERAAAMVEASDAEIYTGSILYMPNGSDVCRQLLFDNHNGQFADNGYVNCNSAAYPEASVSSEPWPAGRLRVISTGFRGR